MSTTFGDKFIKKSNENSSLFHYFPGAIYEFRDRVWRVKEMHGNTTRSVQTNSPVFVELLENLERQDIPVQNFSGLRSGVAEVYPKTWYCSNRSCRRFVSGQLRDRNCVACNSEMRQLPLLVICDNCGHTDQITTMLCRRRHGKEHQKLVMFEREKIGSWRIVCQLCLEDAARVHGFDINNPNTYREFAEQEPQFKVASDLDPGSRCRGCQKPLSRRDDPGKRVVPAGANIISPAFRTAFDKDIPSIMSSAKTMASKTMSFDEDVKHVYERIKEVYGIKEIYLSDITALNCTYGWRVGRCTRIQSFPDATIYVKADPCEAIIIEFEEKRIPEINRQRILHAMAHALLQVAGYVTGLGNEVYKEYVDPKTNTVMIFTPEAGGCELLINEPAKLTSWLKRSRAIAHECKNQCAEGCPWCLHIKTFQCPELNHNLDRKGLVNVWSKQLGV